MARDVWGPAVGQKYKVPRMYHFEKKIQTFASQRGPVKMFGGPARMFPRAPLWLSTGLSRSARVLDPPELTAVVLNSPSPFITTQPPSCYSFYRPTEGRRLSRHIWLFLYRDDIPSRKQSPPSKYYLGPS